MLHNVKLRIVSVTTRMYNDSFYSLVLMKYYVRYREVERSVWCPLRKLCQRGTFSFLRDCEMLTTKL